MANHKVTVELNMEKLIDEIQEVAQEFNELANNLKRIEKKYADKEEEKE